MAYPISARPTGRRVNGVYETIRPRSAPKANRGQIFWPKGIIFMTTATPTIGQDFAARIEALGISQEFLAQYVGLSQSEISKLISGVRPQGEGHRKINDALRDLENVVECFRPMKPLFDDADA